jgi:hypothetical protein
LTNNGLDSSIGDHKRGHIDYTGQNLSSLEVDVYADEREEEHREEDGHHVHDWMAIERYFEYSVFEWFEVHFAGLVVFEVLLSRTLLVFFLRPLTLIVGVGLEFAFYDIVLAETILAREGDHRCEDEGAIVLVQIWLPIGFFDSQQVKRYLLHIFNIGLAHVFLLFLVQLGNLFIFFAFLLTAILVDFILGFILKLPNTHVFH